jgi:hypothetical protein
MRATTILFSFTLGWPFEDLPVPIEPWSSCQVLSPYPAGSVNVNRRLRATGVGLELSTALRVFSTDADVSSG